MLPQYESTIQSIEVSCSVNCLSRDMRRMLAVQFKEFIHYLEDYEHNIQDQLIIEGGDTSVPCTQRMLPAA